MTEPQTNPRPGIAGRAGNALPTGSVSIGGGLFVLGLTSYVFLVIAGRLLGPVGIAPLSSLWALTFTVGPGVFMPLEQETSRLVANEAARGAIPRRVVTRVGTVGLVLAGALSVLILITLPFTAQPLFASNGFLIAGLLVSIVGFAGEHLLRGILSGLHRFRRYAAVLATEGVGRLFLCGGLAAWGVASVGPYGLALGAGPLLALGLAVRARLPLDSSAPPRWLALWQAVGWLVAGSVLAQGLTNAPLLAAPLLASSEQQSLVGAFLASFVVARVPIFGFVAIQAALLPQLSMLAAGQKWRPFEDRLRSLAVLVIVLGATSTLLAWFFGPWVVGVMFGEAFALASRDLALITAGASVYMLAVSYAQALIALGAHAKAAFGFACGLAIAVVGFSTGIEDLPLRLELGFLAGASSSAIMMFGLAHRDISGRTHVET